MVAVYESKPLRVKGKTEKSRNRKANLESNVCTLSNILIFAIDVPLTTREIRNKIDESRIFCDELDIEEEP